MLDCNDCYYQRQEGKTKDVNVHTVCTLCFELGTWLFGSRDYSSARFRPNAFLRAIPIAQVVVELSKKLKET
jgi:hypothetical protein